jgi:sigma-B regulation protein RsbU (phosphoserine phosphatase)
VERLNRLFRHNITLTKFVSLFVGHLDLGTGRLSYVNAGHNPPLLIARGSGTKECFTVLVPSGPAIGIVEDAKFETREVSIGPGVTLVLYTDGIVEARSASGEEFGEERLKEALLHLSPTAVQQIAQGIRTELQQFTGRRDLDDDATMVVFQRDSP